MPSSKSGKNNYESILSQLNNIGIALSSERNLDRLLEIILEKAKSLSNADNGTLYLLDSKNQLKFTIMQSDSLNMKLGGTTGKKIPLAPVKLYDSNNRENHKRIVAHAAITKKSVNVKDLYCSKEYDFSGTKAFDKLKGYHSKSVLAVPMLNRDGKTAGILHLVNAQNSKGHIIPFSKDVQHFVESLASQAAVTLDNQRLIKEQDDLLEGIIKMIALAIDAKSEHTSNHCEAIPVITEMLAKAANKQKKGYFKDFYLDENQMHELRVASWLHDCGKLTTPLYILNKATKLEGVFDRIEYVKVKMEVLARDYEIKFLKGEITEKEFKALQKKIKKDFEFLQEMNKGAEFLDEKKHKYVEELSKLKWNPRIGKDKKAKNLLSDDEFENMSIKRGTINAAERKIINEHMKVTIDMLESLPFPSNLKNVPEYAGGHHEKMDGTGFPKGLKRHEMSAPARMMAVADIFEALTSHDRPYKEPKTLSETLKIMAFMKKDNHIDPDVFDLFVKEKLYLKYARKYLLPKQIDKVDTDYIMEISSNKAKESA